MKIEATIVIENSIDKDQIDALTKRAIAVGAQQADIAKQVHDELTTVFGNMTQAKDANGNPTHTSVTSVKVFVDGENTPCNTWPKGE